MKPTVSLGAPLLASRQGAPRLYPALGIHLHLEPLTVDDEGALEQVNAIVYDWIGSELAWSMNTTFPILDPFRASDLDYIPGYAAALVLPPGPDDPAQRDFANRLFAATFGEFTLAVSGGEDRTFASPYSYRFAAEMRRDDEGEGLHTSAMLRVTVPTAWPLGDFYERCCRIVGAVRVRWGSAGLTYASWEMAAFNQVRQAIYAHGRRYHGYDMGQYATYLETWHRHVRTVNWLTFLGEDFAARVEATGRKLESRGAVRVARAGSSVLFQAGEQPEEGDINRLRVPPAYVQLDEMIRPVRVGAGIDFRSPWDKSTSEAWLRRFEKRMA